MLENFTFHIRQDNLDLTKTDDQSQDELVVLAFPNQLSPQQVISRLRMRAFDIQTTNPSQSLEYRQMIGQITSEYLTVKDSV